MICCAVAFLSFSGFSEMNMRAVLAPPVKPSASATPGSALTISDHAQQDLVQRLERGVLIGQHGALMRPLSCSGKNPFGTWMNR